VALFSGTLHFAIASLPTLALRIVLEVAQAHMLVEAVVRADRSTFGLVRVSSIALLALIDAWLGYALTGKQWVGLVIVVAALLVLFLNHGVHRRGIGFVLFTAINAAFTISLYKYHITHYNSWQLEQAIVIAIILIYFAVLARRLRHEHPLRLLKRRKPRWQAIAAGLGNAAIAAGYLYTTAAIATAAKRGGEVLASVISGKAYFHEKGFYLKLVVCFGVIIGLVFMFS
jgi:hypothetical protein